ncbi:MAG: hypothetical protein B0D92_02520 [Spirochaeta sp. LUC14_002_19_P3]|nr:MAG: hypothetical protein B0D92_02520 [Spirochaeta sp. LUC14_002_19_P3]
MNSHSVYQNALRPTVTALSDTWLQIRAKPILYILLWGTLALAPVVVLNLLFSSLIETELTALLEGFQNFAAFGNELPDFPPEIFNASLKLCGFYGIIWTINALTTIYYGAVLAGTVSRFRQHVMPRYSIALADGASRYMEFFKAVLVSAWKIFWKPVVVILAGSVLSAVSRQNLWFSISFFCSMFLTFTGIYRFGLGPFILLSTKCRVQESSTISMNFYSSHRPVVSMLFLCLVFLPVLITLMLFSLFIGMSAYSGLGMIVLWLVQSLVQFAIIMTFINFAMNTFQSTTEHNLDIPLAHQ